VVVGIELARAMEPLTFFQMKVFNVQLAIRYKSATQLNTQTYCEKTRHGQASPPPATGNPSLPQKRRGRSICWPISSWPRERGTRNRKSSRWGLSCLSGRRTSKKFQIQHIRIHCGWLLIIQITGHSPAKINPINPNTTSFCSMLVVCVHACTWQWCCVLWHCIIDEPAL
jgi:hypothetical protein